MHDFSVWRETFAQRKVHRRISRRRGSAHTGRRSDSRRCCWHDYFRKAVQRAWQRRGNRSWPGPGIDVPAHVAIDGGSGGGGTVRRYSWLRWLNGTFHRAASSLGALRQWCQRKSCAVGEASAVLWSCDKALTFFRLHFSFSFLGFLSSSFSFPVGSDPLNRKIHKFLTRCGGQTARDIVIHIGGESFVHAQSDWTGRIGEFVARDVASSDYVAIGGRDDNFGR